MTRTVKRIKRTVPLRGYTGQRVRVIPVGEGLPSIEELREEIDEYMDILLGRKDAPLEGVLALMETADMFYARATEINALIQRGEADGQIQRSSPLVKFRTGELRSFRELAAKAADLGSRRLTAVSVETEQAKLGRESVA
jgi:hypothetical protein